MSRPIVMFNGYGPPPTPRAAIVLLSGLDSAAAMHWALARYAPVVALGFDYGQPQAEIVVSQGIAERRGVIWRREIVPGIGERKPDAGRDAAGVSRAVVPARNGILAWHAGNVAARMFSGGRVAIVVGCNADDAAGFPDCGPEFLQALNYNVGAGLAGMVDVQLVAPWVSWLTPTESMHKTAIIRWAASHPDPAVLADVRFAVSCYRGTRCGVCDACALRAQAFAEAGIEDGSEPPPVAYGGDPGRGIRK